MAKVRSRFSSIFLALRALNTKLTLVRSSRPPGPPPSSIALGRPPRRRRELGCLHPRPFGKSFAGLLGGFHSSSRRSRRAQVGQATRETLLREGGELHRPPCRTFLFRVLLSDLCISSFSGLFVSFSNRHLPRPLPNPNHVPRPPRLISFHSPSSSNPLDPQNPPPHLDPTPNHPPIRHKQIRSQPQLPSRSSLTSP